MGRAPLARGRRADRLPPWRSCEFSKFGRGAESCLVSLVLCGTSQRPVRRLLPATSVSLQGSSRRCSSDLPKHGRTDLPPTLRRLRQTLVVTTDAFVRRHHPRRPPLCAAQARPARSFGLQETGAGPKTRASPRVAGGRPFSANPVHEVLRLPLMPRAGPTSPARLPVYPRAERGDYGRRLRGWGCGRE